MAIAEDASAPAAVRSASGTTGLTITTASFTPPAASLEIVSFVAAHGSRVATQPLAVSDSLNRGGWNVASHVDGDTATAFAIITTWWRYNFTAPGAHTVTGTRTGAGAADLQLVTKVLTGASQYPVGAIMTHFTSATSNMVDNLVTTTAGSYVFIAAGLGSNVALTPNAQTASVDLWADATNASVQAVGKGSALVGTPGSTSYGWTGTGTWESSWSAMEFKPLPTLDEEAMNSQAMRLMKV